MSNFTPLVEKTYEFEGDTIKVLFSRLKREDMLSIMPDVQRRMSEDREIKNLATANILNKLLGVLPKYIKEFEGLSDKDGKAVTPEIVSDEMYFIELSTSIIMDIISESVVLDEKN